MAKLSIKKKRQILKGGGVAGSRLMFCMELIELTSLILNICQLFGFGAWGKSYGVFKSKFSVLDRQPVKMVPRHVVMTNQRHCDVNLLQTCQATIISTNHVAVWPTTLSKIDFSVKNVDFFYRIFQRTQNSRMLFRIKLFQLYLILQLRFLWSCQVYFARVQLVPRISKSGHKVGHFLIS